jgi:hypothetical protein
LDLHQILCTVTATRKRCIIPKGTATFPDKNICITIEHRAALRYAVQAFREVGVQLYSFLILALDGSKWATACPLTRLKPSNIYDYPLSWRVGVLWRTEKYVDPDKDQTVTP